MLEKVVESHLKRLEGYGFKILKLRTPGYAGTKDRLMLAPKWSPAPPAFVECKRPGKEERALQAAVRDDWRARGCDVRNMVSTPEEVEGLIDALVIEAYDRLNTRVSYHLPKHIREAYFAATLRSKA